MQQHVPYRALPREQRDHSAGKDNERDHHSDQVQIKCCQHNHRAADQQQQEDQKAEDIVIERRQEVLPKTVDGCPITLIHAATDHAVTQKAFAIVPRGLYFFHDLNILNHLIRGLPVPIVFAIYIGVEQHELPACCRYRRIFAEKNKPQGQQVEQDKMH